MSGGTSSTQRRLRKNKGWAGEESVHGEHHLSPDSNRTSRAATGPSGQTIGASAVGGATAQRGVPQQHHISQQGTAPARPPRIPPLGPEWVAAAPRPAGDRRGAPEKSVAEHVIEFRTHRRSPWPCRWRPPGRRGCSAACARWPWPCGFPTAHCSQLRGPFCLRQVV
jgi:hypothetical protein